MKITEVDWLIKMQAEIQELYSKFSFYPKPKSIESCSHCGEFPELKILCTKKLKELTWDDFGRYPFKAMTTMGNEQDFKYFLPRILELWYSDYHGSHYGIDTLFSKLEDIDQKSWLMNELSLLKAFFTKWLSHLKQNHHSKSEEWESTIYEEVFEELKSWNNELIF